MFLAIAVTSYYIKGNLQFNYFFNITCIKLDPSVLMWHHLINALPMSKVKSLI